MNAKLIPAPLRALKLKSVTIFLGSDRALINESLYILQNQLESLSKGSAFEIETISCDALSYEAGFLQSVSSQELFPSIRVIKIKIDAVSNKVFIQDLNELINKVNYLHNNNIYLQLFIKGKPQYNAISKIILQEDKVLLINCETIKTINEKIAFLQNIFDFNKRHVARDALLLLANADIDDSGELRNIAYTIINNSAGNIDINLVKKYIYSGPNISIFKIADAVLTKNSSELKPLLLQARISKIDNISILNAIALNMRLVALMQNGNPGDPAIKKLNIAPFQLSKAKKYSYNYSKAQIKQILTYISYLDKALKGGEKDASWLLESFLLCLAS